MRLWIKICGIVYIVFWGLFLSGLIFATAVNLRYRPSVLMWFGVIAFLYPVIVGGAALFTKSQNSGITVWRQNANRVIRIFKIVVYCVAAVIISFFFLYNYVLAFPKENPLSDGRIEIEQTEFFSRRQSYVAERRLFFFMKTPD